MTLIAVRSGRTTHDAVAAIKTLACLIVSAGDYMTLESPVGTDYQVPVGKTFYITRVHHAWAGAPNTFAFGYGDTGVASGAPAPTNPVVLTAKFSSAVTSTTTIDTPLIAIPASKYPFIKGGAGSAGEIIVEGYEA